MRYCALVEIGLEYLQWQCIIPATSTVEGAQTGTVCYLCKQMCRFKDWGLTFQGMALPKLSTALWKAQPETCGKYASTERTACHDLWKLSSAKGAQLAMEMEAWRKESQKSNENFLEMKQFWSHVRGQKYQRQNFIIKITSPRNRLLFSCTILCMILCAGA